MNALKRIFPNLITLANLTCGLFSVIFAFQGSLELASLCIFTGAFFDFFDGFPCFPSQGESGPGIV